MEVEGVPWLLILSLHEGSATAVNGKVPFLGHFRCTNVSSKTVSLVLSIDLYKVFNGSLDRLVVTKGGFNIGEICCAAPTCADDTSPMSDELSPLHSLVSEAEDFSVMELFVLQL